MSVAMHSPGPWQVYDGSSEYTDALHCVGTAADGIGCGHVATCETAADAHLIATAPDLRAALEELLFAARDAGNGDAEFLRYSEAVKAGFAALAKADGAQP